MSGVEREVCVKNSVMNEEGEKQLGNEESYFAAKSRKHGCVLKARFLISSIRKQEGNLCLHVKLNQVI